MKLKTIFKLIIALSFLIRSETTYSQAGVDWQLTGNAATFADFLGTTNAQHLKIRTANIERAWFTTGNLLSGVTGSPGDGLSIKPKPAGQCSYTSLPGSTIDL